MKKIWFTNRDGDMVTYDVPDEVAEAFDDLWECLKSHNYNYDFGEFDLTREILGRQVMN